MNEHFAGLERDAESGTEHAQFRNYASVQGRWLAPDPYLGSYDLANPQSMNRYAYALNNPTSMLDPSGLDGCGPDVGDANTGVVTGCTVDGGDTPYTDCWWCSEYGGSETGGTQCWWCALPPKTPTQTPPPAHLETLSNAPNNAQQTQQQCLNDYYSSTPGKVADFGSLLGIVSGWSPNASSNLKEISTLGAAKYVGLTGAAKLANTYDIQQIGTLNSVVNIGSSVGAGLSSLVHGITQAASVLSIAATVTDLSAHYACWAAGNPSLADSWAQNQQY